MECSLTDWPSIGQIDDIVWTGIEEMDPFESLEQSNGTDNADSNSSSSASVCMESEQYLQLIDTVAASNVQKFRPVCSDYNGRTQNPNMLQTETLATWRWDSMNATDLASVLDSTFSCQSVSCITSEEGEYTLYGDELLMEPERILRGEFDIFTSDPICDNTNTTTAAVSNTGVLNVVSTADEDSLSFLSSKEKGTMTYCKSETVGDMNNNEENIDSFTVEEIRDDLLTQAEVQLSLTSVPDCKLKSFEVSQLPSSDSERVENKMKLANTSPLSLPAGRRSHDVQIANLCSSADNERNTIASTHHCTQTDRQQQLLSEPVTNATKSIDQGNHLCPSTMKVEDVKISMTSSHRKAAVSSRLSSQKKINRAQASRARRLAAGKRRAEGRARKYALHKLMLMSSSSTSRTCHRLSPNCATLKPMLHTSGEVVSQSLIGLPRAHPSQLNEMKQQIISHSILQKPMLLPVVVSPPTFSPTYALHSNPNVGSSSVEVDPNVIHGHQQIRSQYAQYEVPTESLHRSSMDVLKEVQVNTRQKSSLTSLSHGDQDLSFSSESTVVQPPLPNEHMQSMPKVAGMRFQSSVSSLRAVKGNEFALTTESSEAAILKQLENVVRKLDGQTRLRICDSLYRLARSAKLRQNQAGSRSTSNFKDAVETETNSIDRWIANLLFSKQPSVPNCQICPPKSSDATCQALYRFPNAHGNTYHWNACVNPQEIMLCTY